jgi:hypothetical protein
MKTAICLYGHARTFIECYPELLENVIKPNNIKHIFCVLWTDSFGFFQHPEASTDHKNHIGYDPQSIIPDSYYLQTVLDHLRPTKVQFDNYFLHDEEFGKLVNDLESFHHPSIHHRPKGTIGQVWGRCTSIALKKQWEIANNIKFDKTIVTRWDIGYNDIIDLNTLDNDKITHDNLYGPDVISDMFMTGPNHLIDLFGTQFDSINELVENGTMNLGPHEWLSAHFKNKNIPRVAKNMGTWIRR